MLKYFNNQSPHKLVNENVEQIASMFVSQSENESDNSDFADYMNYNDHRLKDERKEVEMLHDY